MCEVSVMAARSLPRVVFECRRFLVLDKPAGLRTVPGRAPDADDSVETRVRVTRPEASGPLIVHRLDIETSGLLVVALDAEAHSKLSRQFQNRKVGKRYVAMLGAGVVGDEGAIELPLVVDWPNRPRQKVCHDTGRPSRTLWRVRERRDESTRVELRPETGRTHQLRVHAATDRDRGGIGQPILGDTLYGDPASAPRLMLHADRLAFWDLDTRDWLRFEAPPAF